MPENTREFQIFAKPVGARCNLSCRYCYYLKNKGIGKSSRRLLMDMKVLEKYVIQHIEASSGEVIFFSWHGGEPLLAGIQFFRSVAELQKKYVPEGRKILNGIQTNGTLIDEEWCSFFADENFIVGLSLDGPKNMHDNFRVAHNGKPSFAGALKGFRSMKKFNIETEILCVVNSDNVNYPLAVYRFFKELGVKYITFLPLVEQQIGSTNGVNAISVSSLAFGEFLCSVFDEWVEQDIGNVKIQIIEEAIRPAFNQEHTLCIFKEVCGGVPVIEQSGDFYSCDHYVDRNHLVGNILTGSLAVFLDSEQQQSFGILKKTTLPKYCLDCNVRSMCNGECPKNRFIKAPNGEPGLNYLCEGYKKFFNHIKPLTETIAAAWHAQNL